MSSYSRPRGRRIPRRATTRIAAVCLALLWALDASAPAAAEALDLQDSTPRAVAVRFEMSPPGQPGDLDVVYSAPLAARLEPAGEGRVRIVIAGGVVERSLFRDLQPKPGTFSDFIWLFDTASGEVLHARLEGTLIESVDWGLFSTSTEARIRVSMSTARAAGYRPPRHLFGHSIFRFCVHGAQCRLVPAVPLDPERGYVNAVGAIEVESLIGVSTESFSPLGEAVFSEWDERPGEVAELRSSDRLRVE